MAPQTWRQITDNKVVTMAKRGLGTDISLGHGVQRDSCCPKGHMR